MSGDDELAKRLLQRASRILKEVDEAYIIKQRGHHQRAMPAFRPEELSLGKTLGTGGFGIVSEILKFTLDPDEPPKEHPCTSDAEGGDPSTSDNPQQPNNLNESLNNSDDRIPGSYVEVVDKPEELSMNDHVHYDVKKARHFMAHRCMRNGKARYAIKRLHGNLTPVEKVRGMIDLVVEAKYLATVWHPNIIKLRGIAKGDMIDPGFFIILDRLQITLDVQLKQWDQSLKSKKGSLFGIGKDRVGLKKLLVDRLTVAYDLAAAFFYLHENRVVYRDIKPENIGFDARFDVKVFDFGLCKSLSSNLKAGNGGYGYKLTGRAGSLPYMAPEVVRMETYDTKCDVFSFAILLWEIMSLKQAFQGMNPTTFVERVVVGKARLKIPKDWPPLTRLLIPEAWDDDPRKRPDMKRVAVMIRADLNDTTSSEDVLHRTDHMLNRSRHSARGEMLEISEVNEDIHR